MFKILWLCGILNSTQECHESSNELLYHSINSLLQNLLEFFSITLVISFQSLFATFASLLCLQLLDSLFHHSFSFIHLLCFLLIHTSSTKHIGYRTCHNINVLYSLNIYVLYTFYNKSYRNTRIKSTNFLTCM